MSIGVMVVLYNDEEDRLELGPFNQGVLLDSRGLVDVASSKVIASRAGYGWMVFRNAWYEDCDDLYPEDDKGPFAQAHVFDPGLSPAGEDRLEQAGRRGHSPTKIHLNEAEIYFHEPKDGSVRYLRGIRLRYSAADEEWLAEGPARNDDAGNTMVAYRGDDGKGPFIDVCDALGGHVGPVTRAEWESWERLDES